MPARRLTFPQRFGRAEEDIRRLKLRQFGGTSEGGGAGRYFETFIVDPARVRVFSPAFVADGAIVAVYYSLSVGTIVGTMNAESTVVDSFSVSAGVSSVDFSASPIAVTEGDRIWPEITASLSGASAGRASLAFLIEPV